MLAELNSALVESEGTDLPTVRSETEPHVTQRPSPTLSVIVPTYNEAENIVPMLRRLRVALSDSRPDRGPRRGPVRTFEIIVVDDDSGDGTADLACAEAHFDPRITVLRRTGQRGLSSAVLAGMRAADGQVLAVIDADLQHDESKLPEMADAILAGRADVSVGSRHVDGGGFGSFGRRRRLVSWTGTVMAQAVLGVTVTDPMSGFFAISRRRFADVADSIDPRGFKILLEFLARGPEPTVVEVGYEFGTRLNGTTKLDRSVALAFVRGLMSLAMVRCRRWNRRSRPSEFSEGRRRPGRRGRRSPQPPCGSP